MKKSSKILLATVLAIVISTGCSKEKETVQDSVDPVETEETEEEVIEFDNVFPLTGISTNASIDHHPVAVTINNHRQARPQSGLVDADIVYEVLAEYELTRLVAIYHSHQPSNIGPVRSARGYHIDLSKGYDAFFVSHGWSPEAKDRLLIQNETEHINGMEGNNDGALFKRSSERKAPHNSYISFANIEKGLESKGYNLSGEAKPLSFYEDIEVAIDGFPASEVKVLYNNLYDVTYKYDEARKAYSRYNGSSQSIDYETEVPLNLHNIFIVEAEHKVVDDQGRRQINLTSGGKAILLQNGVSIELEWVNEDGRILPAKNGEIIKLLQGQTWINIIPTSIEQRVVIEE
ncbi:DUF3048 domain-containing protein [Alkalihalobacterium alkalinitrilicum]|uniref:DUF3048 domain-containing protein n=1 Tax=Alkalihalobacterium alkalinitrilicum TaxID=427920 RepID=UPI00114FDABA|nr:DUF3048 domain-containing protein [Alkalihalobacterium alkalinitrilicum]